MRLQHNISPPLPGRGGSRKRKRGDDPPAAADVPPHPNAAPDPAGFTTFKVEPHTPREPSPGPPGGSLGAGGLLARGGHEDHGQRSPSPEDGGEDDGLPAHLADVADPATGLIFGRSPAMVRYLVMKAKEQYALREHYALIEELRTLRAQERAWREAKDVALDDVLRAEVGCVSIWVSPFPFLCGLRLVVHIFSAVSQAVIENASDASFFGVCASS